MAKKLTPKETVLERNRKDKQWNKAILREKKKADLRLEQMRAAMRARDKKKGGGK